MDILLYMAPDFYTPYITTDRKGIKRLITQCTNAIYRKMVSSLLNYYFFCKTLKLNKFKMNPYYPCVANQLVNVLQQYIPFRVDDCKLIHKYLKVNDSFIGLIHEEYQSIFEYMDLVQ